MTGGGRGEGETLIISPRKSVRGLYVYQARPRTANGAPSPRAFMRYENEDGRNKSDVGGSSESFLKAPRVTRQVYAETSIIPVTYFIASWANSGSPRVLRVLPPQPLLPGPAPAWSRAMVSPLSDPPTFLSPIDSSSVSYELPDPTSRSSCGFSLVHARDLRSTRATAICSSRQRRAARKFGEDSMLRIIGISGFRRREKDGTVRGYSRNGGSIR
jgi:hypothetical protein